MKRMTKLLSLMLAALMLVGMLPLGVWAAGETHTVRFNLNYNGAPKLFDQQVADGDYATQPEDVVRDGWHFSYWYVKRGNNQIEKFDLATTPITTDVTLYARWTEDTLARAEKMAQGLELAKRMEEKEEPDEEPEESEKPSYEEIIRKQEEELEEIKDLNNGELPEISLDEEDYIPSAIIGTYSDEIVRDYSTAIESLKDIASLMGFTDVEKEFKGETTHTFQNTIQYRLQQVYKGAEVYGKQLIVTTDENGKVTALTGNYDPIYNIIDTTISVEEAEAYAVIAQEGIDCVDEDGGELVVYSLDGYNEYAWLFIGTDTVLVSAVDGSVLLHFTNIITGQPKDNWEPTIGRTNENPPRTFNTAYDPDEKTYVFYDSVRNILYHDLEGKYPGEWRNYYNSDLLKDTDNVWNTNGAKKVIDLYKLLSGTYDYYLNTIGLLSYDGNGGQISAFVNDNFDSGNNAFNHGPFLVNQKNITHLAFGKNEGLTYDLVGHEFTHAVQHGLIPEIAYSGESGALMEGYSDVGGELVELYNTGSADWIHHENRNLMDPTSVGQFMWDGNENPLKMRFVYPEKYKGTGYYTGTFDNGGVHHNSTVISHTMYSIFMAGVGQYELTELLFRAWSYLYTTANFYDYRMAMLASARDMHLSETKITAIKKAFDDANIIPEGFDQFFFASVDIDVTVVDKALYPIENAKVQISNGDGSIVAEAYCDADGKCHMDIRSGLYILTASAIGYKSDMYAINTSIFGKTTLYIKLQNTSNQPDKIKSALGGVVTDALTGEALSGVKMYFRKGYNVITGRTAVETTTGIGGKYYIDSLPYGYYTVQLEKAGYISSYVILQAAASNWDESIREDALRQNLTLSPYLTTDNTLRIVLSWGQDPADLDSHITGKLSDGNDFHVYFSNKQATDPNGTVVAKLDIDDTTSYGPETITLQWANDVTYRYYIHLYSGNGTLSTSNANIKVYSGSALLYSFDVPEGSGTCRIWDVFTFENGVLTPTNTFRD